ELFLSVDLPLVFPTVRERARVKRLVYGLQNRRRRAHELFAWNGLLVLGRAVPSSDEQRILLDVPRPDLDPEWHAFLDPVPHLLAAALIALVDDDIDGSIGKTLRTQRFRNRVTVLEHARTHLVRVDHGNDDDVRGRELR